MLEGTTFMFIRHKNLYLVAATTNNPNTALIFEYLFQKIRIFKSYLGENFDDESLQSNFTLIYELFDETMDYGYPQNCATDVLRLYINLGTAAASAGIFINIVYSLIELNIKKKKKTHTHTHTHTHPT